MFCVIVIFLSDDMAKIVLKSCETCNASTLLHTPAGDVRPVTGAMNRVAYIWQFVTETKNGID